MSDPVAQGGDERELRRLNRALRMLSDSNQSLIRITDEGQLLNEVCRIAVETGGYRMAWVGFPENDERKTVRVVAVVGFDRGYLESMGIVWADVPRGRGPAGTAIRTGRPCIIHDIRTDPNTAPWREAARERGYESIAALPLLSEGRVLGALSVNAGEAGAFDDEEIKILTELAGDLAFGLAALRTRAEHARAEERLHKSEQEFRAFVENSPDLILRFDRDFRLTYVNPAMCRLFRLPAEKFLGTVMGTATSDGGDETNPEGLAQARGEIARVFASGESCECEVRWPTPEGERTLAVRYFPERDRAGEVVSVLAITRDITERRRAEEALQNVLRHARTTAMQSLVTAPDGWDQHGPEWSATRYRWESHFEDEAAAQAVMPLELAPGERYYDGWVRAKHPDDLAPMNSVAAGAFVAGAASWQQEFRAIDRHGRVHWFAQVASIKPAGHGRWHVTTINTDITERRDAEDALQSVLRHARAMVMHGVATAPEGWDRHEAEWSASRFQWTARFLNEAAAQEVMPLATGPGESYHAAWVRARHPDDLGATDLTAARAFVAGASHWRQEFRAIDRAGRVHWFAQVASLRAIGPGRWQATTINTDITERKAAEETLRWRTALFEAQVDSTLDAILVVDSHGTKLLQNERMNELWKIPRHIIENQDDAAQLRYATSRTKDPVKFAAKVAYLYSHPEEISRDEVELVDGTVLDRYSAPVRDKTGRHYGRIWTFRDVTATRQLEEQFRQAQKMEAVGQLAGGIAHDFNNLLTVIQLHTSMILLEPSLGAAIEQSAQQIKEAAMRAANLTRQLLTFSRQNVKQARALDIGEVVTSTTKLLRRVLGEDVSLESRFASSLPLVQADPSMMEQVLMNLVINARDAMPGGGQLCIALDVVELDADYVALHAPARTGRFVRLSVSDTGIGISPENLPRVFEPFFTTKEIGKGTGLGLATVYGIVHQHQGWIEAESEPGRGSTFRVFLPPLDAVPAGEVVPPEATACGGSETVLLVEDEDVVRAVTTEALQRSGYRVLGAATAAEALRCWEEQEGKIDLLLTDLIMPGGVSGQKLAEELRARAPDLSIIFTSGYSSETVNRELQLTAGRNFLPKPYLVEELLKIVRRKLDEP